MLYQLGPLQMQVAPFNVHETERDATTDFAEHPVLGGPIALEHVGEGADAFTLVCTLWPQKFGGLSGLALLGQMRSRGIAQMLVRGDGFTVGWVKIRSVRETASHLDRHGVGRMIEVEISCQRCGAPSAEAYVGQFLALLG